MGKYTERFIEWRRKENGEFLCDIFHEVDAEIAALNEQLKDLRAAWIPCTERLPEPSNENKLQSVKVINQDGDSVYYSYGYKRWEWYLSVNFEEECPQPLVTHWQHLPPPPESERI